MSQRLRRRWTEHVNWPAVRRLSTWCRFQSRTEMARSRISHLQVQIAIFFNVGTALKLGNYRGSKLLCQ